MTARFGNKIRSVPLLMRWGIAVVTVSGVTISGAVIGAAAPGGWRAGGGCPPESASLPPSVRGAYDRTVLSLVPALYLTMANPSKGTEPDLSGNGLTGTYLPADDSPTTVALPDGEAAAAFNGNGQYLQVPSAASLSVSRTGCLTVQAWMRPANLQFPHEEGSGYVYILGKGATGKQEYALRMYSLKNAEVPVRPNRVSGYVFNLDGGYGSGAYFQDRIKPHSWMMITFVIDDHPSPDWPSGYVAIYKNDQLRGQVSISQFHVTPRSADAPLRIATRQLSSFFEGAIGKVAVFDYVLSPQQVQAIYGAMWSVGPKRSSMPEVTRVVPAAGR